MAVGIYSYTFDFDTFKNDTFKSVISIYSQMTTYWDHFDNFGENFHFDTFENDTFDSV